MVCDACQLNHKRCSILALWRAHCILHEQGWPLEGRMGIEKRNWVMKLEVESSGRSGEAQSDGLPVSGALSAMSEGGFRRGGVARIGGWGWPVVLVTHQVTWARMSREDHGGCSDKEKRRVLSSLSPLGL